MPKLWNVQLPSLQVYNKSSIEPAVSDFNVGVYRNELRWLIGNLTRVRAAAEHLAQLRHELGEEARR